MIKKKALYLMSCFLIAITIAACSQRAAPVNENAEEIEKQSDLTLEEVYQKSLEASEKIKSMTVTMELDQEISYREETEQIKSTIEMDLITDPPAFHQKMKMHAEEIDETFETEAYYTKDGMFFYDPEEDAWMKLSVDMSDEFLQISGKSFNPSEELKKLKDFIDDFSFEQDENHYKLKLNASGEKFELLMKETIQETLPTEFKETLKNLDGTKIRNVQYEYFIDKISFLPVEAIIQMDMDISSDGENFMLKQFVRGKYKDFNHIDEIAIPQKIIDEAVELQM